MTESNKFINLEKRDFSPAAKMLFMNDFKKFAEEYFECEGIPDIDVTRSDDGYSVCIIFRARRVKKVKQIV